MSSGCVPAAEPPESCSFCPGRRGLSVEHRPRPPPSAQGGLSGHLGPPRSARTRPCARRSQPPPHGGVHSTKLALSPPLRPGFSLLPAQRPLPGVALGAPAPRRTAVSAHPGLAHFGLSLFLKSRKSISPNGRRAVPRFPGGSALLPPPPPPPAPPGPALIPPLVYTALVLMVSLMIQLFH